MPEFEPITPHIWRLIIDWRILVVTIPVAVWLVKHDDPAEWTLIDTGTPAHAVLVMDAASRLLAGTLPNRIVLTHAHYDHGGGLRGITSRWNLPICAGEREVAFITGAKRYRDIESKDLAFRLGKWSAPEPHIGLPVSQALREGDVIGDMEVVDVPGHTPGMIAFHHKADRAIICGDAFMNMFGGLGAPFAMASPDMASAKASMRKLAALDFDTLLPSHDRSPHGIPASQIRQLVATL